jgi:hypothetical protein
MGKVKQWSVEKKDAIEKMLINMWASIGMDIPSNYEDIVQSCYEDVCETADPENWHSGDVAIAFRRWVETQSKMETQSKKEWDLYVLYGEQATDAYEDEGIEAAVKSVNEGGGSVFHWNSKTNHPLELLSEADGWYGYVELTKEEYDQF